MSEPVSIVPVVPEPVASLPVFDSCGYAISLNDIQADLKRANIVVKDNTVVQVALHYGSKSRHKPPTEIAKTDKKTGRKIPPVKQEILDSEYNRAIAKWALGHNSGEECVLELIGIYYRGVVFGEFIDEDGVKFFGQILNFKKENVSEIRKLAETNINDFVNIKIKSRKIIAKHFVI